VLFVILDKRNYDAPATAQSIFVDKHFIDRHSLGQRLFHSGSCRRPSGGSHGSAEKRCSNRSDGDNRPYSGEKQAGSSRSQCASDHGTYGFSHTGLFAFDDWHPLQVVFIAGCQEVNVALENAKRFQPFGCTFRIHSRSENANDTLHSSLR
jgi:hypothetical protein